MNNKKDNIGYEEFHSGTLAQHSIIKDSNFTYRIIVSVIKKFLHFPNIKFLDIGCGAGTICIYLASKGYKVLGIDISQNAIMACEESAKILNLEKISSFKKMDFPYEVPRGYFNFILCSEVIEHLKDDSMVLNKIFSLLSPGGIAVISTPSRNAPLYKLGLADDFDRRVGHFRRYTVEELIDKCNKIGFEILDTIKTEGIIRNFFFLNPVAGKFVKYIKYFIVVNFIMILDDISLKLFGESDIFVIVKRPL